MKSIKLFRAGVCTLQHRVLQVLRTLCMPIHWHARISLYEGTSIKHQLAVVSSELARGDRSSALPTDVVLCE